MGFQQVRKILEGIKNATKEHRAQAAVLILEDEAQLKELVALTFETNDPLSIKAAWVLEWICTHHDLEVLIPFLGEFTGKIGLIKFDSAIRPCAKICEALATMYSSAKDNGIKQALTTRHIDAIIETGFDWLLTPQKIAVRAYTMQFLYLFGKENHWVHQELAHLIKTKIIHESKGTKARGNHILNLIEKHQNSHSKL